ncbi:MAG: F0F1 ATP synthase subunit gamma [Patescibacteria group bacterium]|nr:F0F1 ATP synthase subunit gamma [Patescibacteria group bacterium]
MKRDKAIEQEIDSMRGLLSLVEAYQEIAAVRMRKVKKSVLSRREFMQGLNEAFGYIAFSYKVYRESLGETMKGTILNTNGKTISVLLSSNTGLYGDVIRKTFELFEKDLKGKETDIVIVGRMGKRFYDSSGMKKTYIFFEMTDKGIDEENIKGLLDSVIDYSNVNVYHGVFKSILAQTPDKTNITGEVLKIEEGLSGYDARFLFEPSVERVAEHFEKQILSLLFEQVVFESGLSKFASRMVSLDQAAENIDDRLEKLDFVKKKTKHKDINSSLQSSIFGGILWN